MTGDVSPRGGRQRAAGHSAATRVALLVAGLLALVAPIAACGSSPGGKSASYQKGHADGSGFANPELVNASVACGAMSVTASVADNDDYLRGCADALQAFRSTHSH